MRRPFQVFLVAGLLGSIVAPTSAQTNGWKNKWYWGAQAGTVTFSTPTQSSEAAFMVGGHWLITRDRVGLHLAVDQVFFSNSTTSSIQDGTAASGFRTIGFTSGRRVQGELYAMPGSGTIQVFAGGGFAIHQVTDAIAQGSFASRQQENAIIQVVDELSTKAFVVFTGGLQLRHRRWVVFAKYQFMPEGRNFLISSEQHAITGGLRFALTSASEDITTER